MMSEIRVRKIRLPAGLPAGQTDELIRVLRGLDAVYGITQSGDELAISYEFPQHCFQIVRGQFNAHAGSAGFRLPQGFKLAILTFMEAIEREHLLSRDGWDKYVQDIHVDYHRRYAPQPGQKRKQWQQYKSGKTPGS
jgi:hypothetical protein